MIKSNLLLALSLTMVLSAIGQSQSTSEVASRIKQVEQNLIPAVRIEGEKSYSIDERMKQYKLQGVSVAVVKDYKLDWAKAYGFADAGEGRKATTETLFQAASISKSLNGVGLLKLAQDGKIDLNTDINNYLTSWKFPYDDVSKGKKITITELLSHTAGLTVHGFRGYAKGEALPTVIQILDGKSPANSDAIRSMFEPDLRPEYSGGGTTITQVIVTDVTHTSYSEFISSTVLKPLGMTSSFFTQPPPEAKKTVLATAYRDDGNEIKGKFHIYPEQAAAGLWTNPTDLSKYMIETQLSLEGESAKVLSKSFTEKRLTPYKENVALGVFISETGGNKYFEHSGGNEGFRCIYKGSLKGGNGIVVMVNSDNGAIIQEIVNSVFSVYRWETLGPAKKIATLTPAQWKSLDGLYELDGNKKQFLQFTSQNNKLILKQLWDNREITFEAESQVDFFCKEFPFPLKFTKNAQGETTQVLAFGRDVWIRVKGK